MFFQDIPEFVICFTFINNEKRASKIKNEVLEKGLCSGITVIPFAKTFFKKDSKTIVHNDLMMIFRTKFDKIEELKKLVLSNNSREVADFFALPIVHASMSFFDWVNKEVGNKDGEE